MRTLNSLMRICTIGKHGTVTHPNGATILAVKPGFVLAERPWNTIQPYVVWTIDYAGEAHHGRYFCEYVLALRHFETKPNPEQRGR